MVASTAVPTDWTSVEKKAGLRAALTAEQWVVDLAQRKAAGWETAKADCWGSPTVVRMAAKRDRHWVVALVALLGLMLAA